MKHWQAMAAGTRLWRNVVILSAGIGALIIGYSIALQVGILAENAPWAMSCLGILAWAIALMHCAVAVRWSRGPDVPRRAWVAVAHLVSTVAVVLVLVPATVSLHPRYLGAAALGIIAFWVASLGIGLWLQDICLGAIEAGHHAQMMKLGRSLSILSSAALICFTLLPALNLVVGLIFLGWLTRLAVFLKDAAQVYERAPPFETVTD